MCCFLFVFTFLAVLYLLSIGISSPRYQRETNHITVAKVAAQVAVDARALLAETFIYIINNIMY